MLSKVPEVTALFWIIKLLSTAGGEAVADFFARDTSLGLLGSLIITTVVLAAALVVQLAVRRYIPIVYWSVIVAVGVAGTLLSDAVVEVLHLSVAGATVLFLGGLLAVFGVWYATEQTLSIHTITTTRRELYYWSAVMATFALGTATGDLSAFALHWGLIPSLALFTAVFVAAGVAQLRFGVNAVATFWLAYVMTRPLGATCADFIAFGKDLGGLGVGFLYPGLAFMLAIGALVIYLQASQRQTVPHE